MNLTHVLTMVQVVRFFLLFIFMKHTLESMWYPQYPFPTPSFFVYSTLELIPCPRTVNNACNVHCIYIHSFGCWLALLKHGNLQLYRAPGQERRNIAGIQVIVYYTIKSLLHHIWYRLENLSMRCYNIFHLKHTFFTGHRNINPSNEARLTPSNMTLSIRSGIGSSCEYTQKSIVCWSICRCSDVGDTNIITEMLMLTLSNDRFTSNEQLKDWPLRWMDVLAVRYSGLLTNVTLV